MQQAAIKPGSIESFVNDTTIKLPRFQRKQTWGYEKDFNLCMSVFVGIPIGAVVINTDYADQAKKSGSKKVKWLLDGRQRLHALRDMRNPESVYSWAKATMGLKSSFTEDEVAKKFWDHVEDYLQTQDEREEDEEETEGEGSPQSLAVGTPEIEESLPPETEQEAGALEQRTVELSGLSTEKKLYGGQEDLKDLLELILIVHPMRKRKSGLTAPFDFQKYIEKLDYIRADRDTGVPYVDSDQLLIWLKARKDSAKTEGQEFPPTLDDFIGWLTKNAKLTTTEEKLKKEVDKRWKRISMILLALDSLDKRFRDGQIGYLELNECDPAFSMKVFEIINTGGELLTAAEILSAKPSWNVKVIDAHPDIVHDKDALYKEMGTPPQDLVRWDVAATLLSRLKNLDFVIGRWTY